MCLCSRVPHNDIAIYLPALLFFRSYNEVFVQTAFIPYYLSTDIDFVCVLCTSSSSAAVACLSLPLSLCVSLFRSTSHNIAISVPTLLFFRSYNEVFVQQHLLPTSLLASIILRSDHGPDSLHAVICDKLTFFTGGCSEGLGAFRFF